VLLLLRAEGAQLMPGVVITARRRRATSVLKKWLADFVLLGRDGKWTCVLI